jgi:hypothetical protein
MGAVVFCALMIVVGLTGTATAAIPTPPFTECPALGFDTSCEVLIDVHPGGALQSFTDPSQGPFDGVEDTLIGVLNESKKTVTSIPLKGADIFGFDGDGLCSGVNSSGGSGFLPPPAGCPFGPTGYEGPNTSFSVTNENEGTVNFPNGVAPGGSAYFSLEGSVEFVCELTECKKIEVEECTLAKGVGHLGTPGPEGLNEDNDLSTTGHPHELEVGLEGHAGHIHLSGLTSATCFKKGGEAEFSGTGPARFSGVSGYTLSFKFKLSGGRIFLTLLLEKEGSVVFSLTEAELKKNSVEIIS